MKIELFVLPEDLYVFDTTLDWLIVFTHEPVTTPETRFCRAFGWKL